MTMKLFCAIVAFAGAAGSVFADPGASMFQNGPAHPGAYQATAQSALKGVRWKFAAGARLLSSPVVWNKLCFAGDGAGVFHALDAATGTERWRFKTGGAIDGAAAADNGIVYFLSRDGFAYALDAAKGTLRWKFKTGGEKKMDEWDFFLSSPMLDRGVLYFGSGDGNVYALDAKSGKKMWQVATGGIVHSSPAVSGDTVYAGNGEGIVLAVNRETGKELWRFKTAGVSDIPKGEVYGSPTVAGETVLVGSKDHTLYALAAADGKLLWKSQVSAGWVISAPAVRNGLAIFGRTGDFNVYAIDLEKSAAARAPVFAWRHSTLMYVFGSAAVAGENAYIGSFNGKLFALDLATGAEKWVFQTDASRAHWDEFYRDGRFQTSLFSRFQRQGAPFDSAGLIDALFTMGSVLSSPWVADGTVYIGSADGELYALDLE